MPIDITVHDFFNVMEVRVVLKKEIKGYFFGQKYHVHTVQYFEKTFS